MLKNNHIMVTQQRLLMRDVDKKIRIVRIKIVHGNVTELHGRFKQHPVRDRVLRFRMGIQQQNFRWLEHHPPPGYVFVYFRRFGLPLRLGAANRPHITLS
ncbi:hypothetical protein D3C73_1171710 [compost metagenome]